MNNPTQHRSWIPGIRGRAARATLALAVVLLSAVITTQVAQAQTFTTLHSFDGTDGSYPYAGLVQATNGDLYGTTYGGGTNDACTYGCGTVFKMTPGGKLTTLYIFCSKSGCTDGEYPDAGLVQATNGNFYGTTGAGGANGYGTVFKMTPDGKLTTLYSFCSKSGCTDGEYPNAGVVQATNGNFYGTTSAGGANGQGTVFKMTPGGTLTTLHSFDDSTDGYEPNALIQATNGDFYGTTFGGGPNGAGTVFKITAGGKLTTLYSFPNITDGANPEAGLVQDTNGNFYGTTVYGGNNVICDEFFSCGTVFKITPGGTLTTLHRFCSKSGCTDGAWPIAGLVQATDGNFYGTTYAFGANGYGTVFKMTPGGTLTTLYIFCSKSGCTDGANPYAGLVQDTNGNLYGTTYFGGTNDACTYGCGTVFSLSVGLGPFVETQPTSGKVGTAVIILGNNLAGATSVTFNGTKATFTASSSEIKTTVPKGATTGKVKVTTPHGTLSSNVNFRVTP